MKRLFEIGPRYLGEGRVKFAWQPSGNYVGVVGEKQRSVFIFDRSGQDLMDEVPLKGGQSMVTFLEWDPDGEMLAILQQGESNVLLWSTATRKVDLLEVVRFLLY